MGFLFAVVNSIKNPTNFFESGDCSIHVSTESKKLRLLTATIHGQSMDRFGHALKHIIISQPATCCDGSMTCSP
jgi:hypothetical protein